jgi:hypothetical protein
MVYEFLQRHLMSKKKEKLRSNYKKIRMMQEKKLRQREKRIMKMILKFQ